MKNYLHLGSEVVLPSEGIIGIFSAQANGPFLEAAAKASLLRNNGDVNRSFVVYSLAGKNRVYMSKISSKKLKKRTADPQGGTDVQEG